MSNEGHAPYLLPSPILVGFPLLLMYFLFHALLKNLPLEKTVGGQVLILTNFSCIGNKSESLNFKTKRPSQ